MPPPALVARFRAQLERMIGPLAPHCRWGVAVSGGADSLALLLLTHAAFPGQVEAATVDHRLRAANANEAAMVGCHCSALGIEHSILRDDAPLPANPGQDWARGLRYRLLAQWLGDQELLALLTAHHADDQAETMLMRLCRGSGTAGLAGVRARAMIDGATVLRPLLGWRRSELRAIVGRHGLAPIEDPSNADPRYDRTRARGLLGSAEWIDPLRWAAAAEHLADAEDALAWAAAAQFAERHQLSGDTLTLVAIGLPREVQRRLMLLALARFGVQRPPGPAVVRLLDTLLAGGAGMLGDVLARGGPTWAFSPAPPRRWPEPA